VLAEGKEKGGYLCFVSPSYIFLRGGANIGKGEEIVVHREPSFQAGR